MRRSEKQIEAMLIQQLCHLCPMQRRDGKCGLQDPRTCGVMQRIPTIAGAINSARGGTVAQHLRKIREVLCSGCPRGTPDGTCDLGDVPSTVVIVALLQPCYLSTATRFRTLESDPAAAIAAIETVIRSGFGRDADANLMEPKGISG